MLHFVARSDERPLPAELVAFLEGGTPPVYVGFGSMRVPRDSARTAIEAIRAQGRRALVSRGWADLALIDDADDCFVVGEVLGIGAAQRSESDLRVPVGRAQDGPGPPRLAHERPQWPA